ncbi:MAG: DNA repair protein RecO [Acidobacteria bacterium]|nr:DNA repair protein RecO [Acidobacteriota bacterium]
MNLHHSEALILRTYPYAEADKIVVLLTRDAGIIRTVAHRAKGSRSRFGSSLELLTYVRAAYYCKEHQELGTLHSCEILRAFPGYQLSWEANLHFSYFAELLLEFGKDQAESENIFRLTLAVLDSMQEGDPRILARYFELWLLKLEGVLPQLDQKWTPELAARIAAFMRHPPAELGADLFQPQELGRLETFSAELIEYHLEKPLRTRKMLKELL